MLTYRRNCLFAIIMGVLLVLNQVFGSGALSLRAKAAALSIVEVDAPTINCIFDVDCTITATDLTGDIILPDSTGMGFLQSRTFPQGEAGTAAAGLYGYLYRVDVREVAGITALPCVSSLSLDFGPIVPLDYDGDSTTDDVFVVTSGGLGTIAPSSADLTVDTLTFHFSPPVCAGSSIGMGESSFFFGLTSAQPSQNIQAHMTGTLGYSDMLNARAPLIPSLALTVDQLVVEPGDTITLTGTGYQPGGYLGTIRWDGADVVTFDIPPGGAFSQPFTIPSNALPGPHTISVCALSPCATGESEQLASVEVEVASKTVFLPIILTGGTPTPAPDFSYTIDPTVVPVDIVLPELNDQPRPLAAIADPHGNVATFVTNELIVQTDDIALLESIIDRYEGEILLEVNPAEEDVAGLENLYLVRVNLATAELAQLTANVQTLDGGENGKASGAHRISSDDGARLLAIASAEAVADHTIGVNWVGQTNDVPFYSFEASSGPDAGYSRNAYSWNYMNRGSVQDIGTADAWNALYYGDKMGNKVKVAVLDGGFAPNSDFPGDTVYLNIFPFDPRNVAGVDSPWHGTNVLQTVAAQSGNGYGVVGVAHTVAEPIALYTSYDYFVSIGSVLLARGAGARIINMSYQAEVPAAFAWTAFPFEQTTAAVRATGALLFASAGNSSRDVDAQDCFFFICWEGTLHTPCENMGVICVGGIDWNSQRRAGGSNFGRGGGVHIFAPYQVYGGQTPDYGAGATMARYIQGTSFSSPYAAGVAALIWAANPGLNANQVWDTMYRTAHGSPDTDVPRYVNAYDAVMEAIGLSVSARIKAPLAGTYQQGLPLTLRAEIGYLAHSSTPPFTVRWTSNLDGLLQDQSYSGGLGITNFDSLVSGSALSEGTHTIKVTVTAGSVTAEDTVVITMENSPPTAEITQPATGTSVCPGETVNFRGSGYDPNEYTGLPESAFGWTSSINGNLGTGSFVSRADLSTGTHTITLRVTDNGGLFAEDAISLIVLDASAPDCIDLPPTATITSPADGSIFDANAYDPVTGWYYRTVAFTGEIGDIEDGISQLQVEWFSSIQGSLGTGTVNTITGEVSLTADLYAPNCFGNPHQITLRVEDSDGNITEDVITVWISLLC